MRRPGLINSIGAAVDFVDFLVENARVRKFGAGVDNSTIINYTSNAAGSKSTSTKAKELYLIFIYVVLGNKLIY